MTPRSPGSPQNRQAHSGGRAVSANDSPAPPAVARRRVTAAEAHRIASTLTDDDRRVVELLSICRVATGGQLSGLLWPDTPTGRRTSKRHLAKLTKLSVTARIYRRLGGPGGGSRLVYALDVVGQRLAFASPSRVRRPRTPGTMFLDHAVAVTETYIRLRRAEASGRIELRGFNTESQAWRAYPGPSGRPITLKPDAYAEWVDQHWEHAAFLEIDQATEHPGRVARKADQYLRYWSTGIEQEALGLFPSVIWIVPDDHRRDQLDAVLPSLDTDVTDPFEVLTMEGFTARINQAPEVRR